MELFTKLIYVKEYCYERYLATWSPQVKKYNTQEKNIFHRIQVSSRHLPSKVKFCTLCSTVHDFDLKVKLLLERMTKQRRS